MTLWGREALHTLNPNYTSPHSFLHPAMICKQLESQKSHGGQQLAMLEEASKLAEGTAHHQAEHGQGHVDVPVPYPLQSLCSSWNRKLLFTPTRISSA